MTTNLLETLRALAPVVTPGEWEVEEGHIQRDSGGIRYWQITDGYDAVACNQFCYAGFDSKVNAANATAIVTLRNALPAIIAALNAFVNSKAVKLTELEKARPDLHAECLKALVAKRDSLSSEPDFSADDFTEAE